MPEADLEVLAADRGTVEFYMLYTDLKSFSI